MVAGRIRYNSGGINVICQYMITKVTKVSLLRINMCDISPHILSVQHHIYLDICAQSGNKNCPHSFYFRRTLSVPIWQMFVLKKCRRSLMTVFFVLMMIMHPAENCSHLNPVKQKRCDHRQGCYLVTTFLPPIYFTQYSMSSFWTFELNIKDVTATERKYFLKTNTLSMLGILKTGVIFCSLSVSSNTTSL